MTTSSLNIYTEQIIRKMGLLRKSLRIVKKVIKMKYMSNLKL